MQLAIASGKGGTGKTTLATNLAWLAAQLVVNKADLNLSVSTELEREAAQLGVPIAGRIPYDSDVTHAQVQRQTVVEFSSGPAARAIGHLWRRIDRLLSGASAVPVDASPAEPLMPTSMGSQTPGQVRDGVWQGHGAGE